MTTPPGDMSLAEVQRLAMRNERRFADLVHRDVYARDVAELRRDIMEIKESAKTQTRLVAAQAFALVIYLVTATFTNLT